MQRQTRSRFIASKAQASTLPVKDPLGVITQQQQQQKQPERRRRLNFSAADNFLKRAKQVKAKTCSDDDDDDDDVTGVAATPISPTTPTTTTTSTTITATTETSDNSNDAKELHQKLDMSDHGDSVNANNDNDKNQGATDVVDDADNNNSRLQGHHRRRCDCNQSINSFCDFVVQNRAILMKQFNCSNKNLLKGDATNKLKQQLLSNMNCDYTEILLQQHEQQQQLQAQAQAQAQSRRGDSGHGVLVHAHLVAASHLLQEFWEIQSLLRSDNCKGISNSNKKVSRLASDDSWLETIYYWLEKFIRTRIAGFYDSSTSSSSTSSSSTSCTLTSSEAAAILSWIHDWQQELLPIRVWKQQPSSTPQTTRYITPLSSPEWQQDCHRLFEQVYLERAVRRPWQELRIAYFSFPILVLSGLANTTTNSNNNNNMGVASSTAAATTMPEQIAQLIDSQLDAANDALPAVYLKRVLAVCHHELILLLGDWMHAVATTSMSWNEFRLSSSCSSSSFSSLIYAFCAMINDCTRLAQLCRERNEAFYDRPQHHRHLHLYQYNHNHDQSYGDENKHAKLLLRQEMKEAIVVQELLSELTGHAARHLMECLESELHPMLTLVGTEAWLKNQSSAETITTVPTLERYFADLERLLDVSNYHALRQKFLKHCFDLTLQTYVESFFANSLAYGSAHIPTTASYAVNEDYLRLVAFFNPDRFANFYSSDNIDERYSHHDINASKLQILQCMSKLIDPDVPANECLGEVQFLMTELIGADCIVTIGDASSSIAAASAAVLFLVGLRSKHRGQNGRESVEWLRIVSQAKRVIAALVQPQEPTSNNNSRKQAEVVNGNNTDQQGSTVLSYKLPDFHNHIHSERVLSSRNG